MKGVLIVGHGSRQKSTELTLNAVTEMTSRELSGIPVEIAYMEFGERDIRSGLLTLIERGAEEIAVAPYFLFDGIHIREDIPRVLEAFNAEFPEIKIVLGRPFGIDARLAAMLCDRIKEIL